MKFEREEVEYLLFEDETLLERAHYYKGDNVGYVTYLRGLIELSNECIKNCLYCGIRRENEKAVRYSLTDEQVLEAARYAYENRYGSIALQAGERVSGDYVKRITELVKKIKQMSGGSLGITLSLGEQTKEVYHQWKKAGADRYLLRIETSNPELYTKIHPNDPLHTFEKRIKALEDLRETGYQVGTGVMIGLPFQTKKDLVDDLFFMKKMDIDMCGMGPYLEHRDTPLYEFRDLLWTQRERFEMTLRMVATLRLMMPKINIAATTALQAIDPVGREKALWAGANVIMPNITPVTTRASYKLYENKPVSEDCLDVQEKSLFERIISTGDEIGFGEQGNSLHYKFRKKPNNG
ncbi:MAG: [FeFe] hydrogenase H-cluster radical SAM maturase HydE [Rikenellaceae bacterium]